MSGECCANVFGTTMIQVAFGACVRDQSQPSGVSCPLLLGAQQPEDILWKFSSGEFTESRRDPAAREGRN